MNKINNPNLNQEQNKNNKRFKVLCEKREYILRSNFRSKSVLTKKNNLERDYLGCNCKNDVFVEVEWEIDHNKVGF